MKPRNPTERRTPYRRHHGRQWSRVKWPVAAAIFVAWGVCPPVRADEPFSWTECNSIIEQSARDPGLQSTGYACRGNAYYSDQKLDLAKQDYENAIRLNTDNATALHGLGAIHNVRGEFQEAIADFDRAIAINPDYYNAYNDRGVAYYLLRNYNKAVQDFDTAIRLKPDEAVSLSNRGSALAELGRPEAAIEDFSRAIELNPGSALNFRNRGEAYIELVNNAADKHQSPVLTEQQLLSALQDFTRAIELDPNDQKSIQDKETVYSLLGPAVMPPIPLTTTK